MKKFLLLGLMAIAALSADAKIFTFGVKAGMNVSSASVSSTVQELKSLNFSARPGFHIGGLVNVSILKFLQVEADLMYSNMRYDATATDVTGEATSNTAVNHYLNIPIALKYNPIAGLYVEAGPQYGFLMTGDLRLANLNLLNADNRKNSEVSIFVGAGYKFGNKILVNARYMWGLNDSSRILGNVKNRNFQISLGYLF